MTLKTFKLVDGKLWCEKHLPKPTATSIADSVSIVSAKNTPKKANEGRTIILGTGEKPSVGADSFSVSHALGISDKKEAVEELLFYI